MTVILIWGNKMMGWGAKKISFLSPLWAQLMAFITLKAPTFPIIFVITNIFHFHTLSSKVFFYSWEKASVANLRKCVH